MSSDPRQLPAREEPYDFARVFGNDHPVELEIGIGKGRFLILQAQERPDTNFIGIEWASKYYRLACARAARRGLANIRFLRDDAAHTFGIALADRSLAGVHVYFPDPWPKKRHHKRRLIQPAFLVHVIRVIRPGGFFKLATDHAGYFEWMEACVEAESRLRVVERLVGEEAREGVTNYEVKYRAEGRIIHNLSCVVEG